MSGRPALVRTRDVKAVTKAARKEGVKQIVVTVGQASVVIPLNAPPVSDDTPARANEWLESDDEDKA